MYSRDLELCGGAVYSRDLELCCGAVYSRDLELCGGAVYSRDQPCPSIESFTQILWYMKMSSR